MKIEMNAQGRSGSWLPGEDPYEIAWNRGVGHLTDVGLLAVILRTGSNGESVECLARRILSISPGGGLTGLYHLSKEQLCEIRGIGKVKAVQLQAVAELSRRIAKEHAVSQIRFTDPGTIAAFYMEDMRHWEQEKVIGVFMGTGGEFLGDTILSQGTVNASLVSPREVFIEALRRRATGVVLLHNHPSGRAAASEEDRLITERLTQCGRMIGIELLDHIIIGDGSYFSFRKEESQ